MAFTVRGRTILITGAGMGMGKLYAERAAAEGAAAVVLWDIDESALQNVAASLASSATAVHTYMVDVASVESITTAAESVMNDVGAPDVLINNAGIVRGKYFWEHDHHSDIDLTLRINTGGPMHVTRAFLPCRRERHRQLPRASVLRHVQPCAAGLLQAHGGGHPSACLSTLRAH